MKRYLRHALSVAAAVTMSLASTVVGPAPAGAVVRTQEYPYYDRNCASYSSPSKAYKLDVCVSIGFNAVNNHVGQVTLACRTAHGSAATCKTLTNRGASMQACNDGGSCTVVATWNDSVPNVYRYVSVPSHSVKCTWDFTYFVAYYSARFPDNTTVVPAESLPITERRVCS
jgi:hypothetical protein